jgi:hypothetical protein
MHPDMLKALADARRADLLRPYEFRETDLAPPRRRTRQPRGGLRHIRRLIGAALVGAGTRLLGDGRPGTEALGGQP